MQLVTVAGVRMPRVRTVSMNCYTILAHCLQGHAPHRASLTSREQELMALLAQKKTDKEIAAALGIEPGTVHSHLTDIFRKLRAKSRAQAVAKYLGLMGETGK